MSAPAQAARGDVVVGLVGAPGTPAALARHLAQELPGELGRRLPDVEWRAVAVEDGLVVPPADDGELVAAARRRLLEEEWDLAVCLTDLPLQVARRPVVAHASPVHGVAVLCVPALGAVGLHRRARSTVLGLVRTLLGDDEEAAAAPRSAGLGRRLRELGEDQAGAGGDGVRFTARVLTGNLRLLVGMVRANQPWRLAAGLSRALAAAVATGVFALVTSDIWRLADAFGAVRHVAVGLGAVVAVAVTLIAGAGLWERARSPRARKQVALFNLATTGTVVVGVLCFYAALLVLALLAALLLVVPALFADAIGHDVGAGDWVELAWLTSSLATAGGALGAGLESDEAVRAAAYAHRARSVDASPDAG
ncbi:hypothetical protein [Quadrisphaera sp. DSM 44207]|uniref:hypothetical protein n=1 Tax=Quadrisphaera sp. DSM 44207 TaxID=1881057 RepID=UPI000883A796|nr:hypothetical protein [Quadrisphaera sp. DSM 44207]SDQ89573.1 hypothetical protein SAMN05428996_3062 [Quadrisphaera sp. DSM 44207]